MIASSYYATISNTPQSPKPSVALAYLQLPLWDATKTRRRAAALYAPAILTGCEVYSPNGTSHAHTTTLRQLRRVRRWWTQTVTRATRAVTHLRHFASLCVKISLPPSTDNATGRIEARAPRRER